MDWKKVGKYSLYLLPGYGIYKELKKPKNKRSTLGIVGFTIYALPFVVKVALLPAWIGAGISTGEWGPYNQIKNIIENTKENKELGNLEKTFYYEEDSKTVKSIEN